MRCKMDLFNSIKYLIKRNENFVKREFDTVCGRWVVDSWVWGGVVFSTVNDVFAERIYIPNELDVIKTHDGELIFYHGDYSTLARYHGMVMSCQ